MALKIFAVFLSLKLLIELSIGQAIVNRGPSLGTIRRSQRPGAYWFMLIFECLVILLIFLHLPNKLPIPKHSPPDWLAWLFLAPWLLVAAPFYYYARNSSWRVRFGISARTAALFAAFVTSAPITVVLIVTSDFRLAFLFFLPFLLMLLALISVKIDSYQ